MALKGEQFKNTYMPGRPDWLSPEHHTQQGPDHLTKLHRKPSYQLLAVTDEEITTFDVEDKTGQLRVISDDAPAPPEELLPGTQRQGMLFDPYTGTGLPRDPTVSKEQRLAAVTRQLDLRGKGAPQLHETYAMGDTPVSEFDRPIVRSPHGERSGASTTKAAEFYEGGPAARVSDRPKIKQGRGQRGGGVYQTRTNTASVNKVYGQKTTDYPTRSLTRPTKDATSTGTEWNPDWYTGGSTGTGRGIIPKGGKLEDEANHGEVTKEILKHSFHNPETGETLNPHTAPRTPVAMSWVEDADSGSHYNTLYVDDNKRGGRRKVTGTSGRPDEYNHLGRFDPREDKNVNDMFSWDSANALKNLHEAGFQSELHRGAGHTGDQSLLPPGVESEAQKANPDRPDNYTPPAGLPAKEYHPREEGSDPRMSPKPVMLPTPAAEGFMTKKVYGGERTTEGQWRDSSSEVSFHKRRIPSETETVERQSKQVTEWPDASTAFHEREHAIDPNIGLRTVNRGDNRQYHIDPVMEGVADAGSDRTIGYANVHEDALNPSLNPSRSFEIEDQKSIRGYGTKNSAWKRPEDRAVYAATRIHSAMADEPNIPDRVDLVLEQHGPKGFSGLTDPNEIASATNIHSERNTDIANDTLLGKLYHENKHVRDGLRDLGFERVGRQAAERHVAQNVQKKELPDWKRDPEQETLFGPSWDPQE